MRLGDGTLSAFPSGEGMAARKTFSGTVQTARLNKKRNTHKSHFVWLQCGHWTCVR